MKQSFIAPNLQTNKSKSKQVNIIFVLLNVKNSRTESPFFINILETKQKGWTKATCINIYFLNIVVCSYVFI